MYAILNYKDLILMMLLKYKNLSVPEIGDAEGAL